MESNLPVIAKKVWNIIRVAFYMLRKGISKGKLILELNNMVLKRRRKLAGKAIANLMMFHHHHNPDMHLQQFSTTREYEFSCSNTPENFFSKLHRKNKFFTRSHAPHECNDDVMTVSAVKAVLEMLNNNNEGVVEASPALPGFGRSPMVRQLRVTDSPFPVSDEATEFDKDHQVDKAAEEFIKRFYKELRKQP
ncbi:hypothetical protein PIB30_006679 [Stylosanthes scabra]|uniref:Avr9/Cf-9 rapidly elicited protein 146 n=1 Tax=Stylosanthes scabra TaxID=79078 RepID=A0ABU6R500_9FABA|nr:hypothetical protein [Stylosanthes scabra]